jgi:NADH-quinone oxidoreductase subunit C
MSEELFSSLQKTAPEAKVRPSLDCPAFNVPAERLPEVCRFLRDELHYDFLVDISGIDWAERKPRFSVAYHLYSLTRHRYVRLVVDCEDDENPKVPSIVSLWPGADWHEREAFDMFGIRFSGHPDLRRILMWDEYPYYPLRKDFPLAGIEAELADAEVGAETGATAIPAPMMGGPFTASPGRHTSENEPAGKDQSWTEKEPKPGQPG